MCAQTRLGAPKTDQRPRQAGRGGWTGGLLARDSPRPKRHTPERSEAGSKAGPPERIMLLDHAPWNALMDCPDGSPCGIAPLDQPTEPPKGTTATGPANRTAEPDHPRGPPPRGPLLETAQPDRCLSIVRLCERTRCRPNRQRLTAPIRNDTPCFPHGSATETPAFRMDLQQNADLANLKWNLKSGPISTCYQGPAGESKPKISEVLPDGTDRNSSYQK